MSWLSARDHGQLDAQRVELAGVFLERLAGVVDDAPALFAGDAAVARPEAEPGPAGAELRGAAAAGDGAAVGIAAPRSTSARLWPASATASSMAAGVSCDRRLLEVGRLFLVVRRLRRDLRAGHVDLLGRPRRPLGTPAAAAVHVDDLERGGHPRGVRLVRGVDQQQPADDEHRADDHGHQDRRDLVVQRLAPDHRRRSRRDG